MSPSWDDVEVGDTVTIETIGIVTEVSNGLVEVCGAWFHVEKDILKSVEKRASRTPADRAVKPCDGSCWRTAHPPVRTFKPGDVVWDRGDHRGGGFLICDGGWVDRETYRFHRDEREDSPWTSDAFTDECPCE